jgi:hypothetical protein
MTAGQTVMNGIEKQAAFYRGYLIDDRSLARVTGALATIVGLWLLVYLVSAIAGPQAKAFMAGPVAHASSHASGFP